MKNVYNVRQNNIKIILGVIFLVTLVFVASYALLGANVIYNGTNITAGIGSRPVFTASGSANINMTVNLVPGTSSTVYLLSTSTNATITANLTTNFNAESKCTYDAYWIWNGDSSAYTITSGATKEFTIKGFLSDTQLFETQVNNTSSGDTKLYTGTITNTSGSVTSSKALVYNANFYKTTQVQTDHLSKNYSGKVVLRNILCSKS